MKWIRRFQLQISPIQVNKGVRLLEVSDHEYNLEYFGPKLDNLAQNLQLGSDFLKSWPTEFYSRFPYNFQVKWILFMLEHVFLHELSPTLSYEHHCSFALERENFKENLFNF